MDWPRLDTSSWNLSLVAAASTMLAACGPFVTLDGETDTDTGGTTDGDDPPNPTNPTNPNPSQPETDTTPPVECSSNSDCEPGWECIGNVCMPYDDYCDTGYCCYEYCCYDDCCYGECYYECYSDEECGPQALCVSDYGYNSCVYPYELPECGGVPEVVVLDLPQLAEGEMVSLSFVAVNGDSAADLVVGRTDGAELHWGANAAPPGLLPVPPGVSVSDAVSGDFDVDGDQDIVVATLQSTLLMLHGDGAGGFTLVEELALGYESFDLVALEWNGDGLVDLAYRSSDGAAQLQLNNGMSAFGGGMSLAVNEVYSVVPTQFEGGGSNDLAVQAGEGTYVFFSDFGGDAEPDLYLEGEAHGVRQLLSGPIDGEDPDEVIGYTRLDDWLLLELWAYGGGTPQRFSLATDDTLAATGDFDGDSVTDVIAAGGVTLAYVRGTNDGYPTLACQSTYVTGVQTYTMAAGDFDGNGRSDVAIDAGGDGGLRHTSIMLSF
jgi:hypothetical protein